VLFYIPNHGHPRQLSFCESVVRLGSIIESPRPMGLITVGYVTVLVFFTHWPRLPEVGAGPTGLPLDKVVHFSLYAILAFLLGISNKAGAAGTRIPVRWLLVAILVFAALDEYTQAYTGRTPDLLDWAADAAGAACGMKAADFCRRFLVPVVVGVPSRPMAP
jgi:hypothetical protein